MDFLGKVRLCADRWVALWAATDPDISLKTLGKRAADNSKLFDRGGMNVATLEKLLAYLGEPSNWPLALVPDDVRETLGSMGAPVGAEAA